MRTYLEHSLLSQLGIELLQCMLFFLIDSTFFKVFGSVFNVLDWGIDRYVMRHVAKDASCRCVIWPPWGFSPAYIS